MSELVWRITADQVRESAQRAVHDGAYNEDPYFKPFLDEALRAVLDMNDESLLDFVMDCDLEMIETKLNHFRTAAAHNAIKHQLWRIEDEREGCRS